jgi:hypothetical protein
MSYTLYLYIIIEGWCEALAVGSRTADYSEKNSKTQLEERVHHFNILHYTGKIKFHCHFFFKKKICFSSLQVLLDIVCTFLNHASSIPLQARVIRLNDQPIGYIPPIKALRVVLRSEALAGRSCIDFKKTKLKKEEKGRGRGSGRSPFCLRWQNHPSHLPDSAHPNPNPCISPFLFAPDSSHIQSTS